MLQTSPEHAAAVTIEAARAELRDATAALRAAFGALTRRTRPVYTTTVTTTAPMFARVQGLTPRIGNLNTQVASLRTTEQVNAQTTTARASSAELGLDHSTAASQLLSEALGLDVTSPSAPSRLASSDDLQLDVTSAEEASSLQSAGEINERGDFV